MTVLIMAICTVLFEKFYTIFDKMTLEARHNQFFFQSVQNDEIFEIFKMCQNNSRINAHYTKGKRL